MATNTDGQSNGFKLLLLTILLGVASIVFRYIAAATFYPVHYYLVDLAELTKWAGLYALYRCVLEYSTEGRGHPNAWKVLVVLILGVSSVFVAYSWCMAQVWGGSGPEFIKNFGEILKALTQFVDHYLVKPGGL